MGPQTCRSPLSRPVHARQSTSFPSTGPSRLSRIEFRRCWWNRALDFLTTMFNNPQLVVVYIWFWSGSHKSRPSQAESSQFCLWCQARSTAPPTWSTSLLLFVWIHSLLQPNAFCITFGFLDWHSGVWAWKFWWAPREAWRPNQYSCMSS